MTNNRAILIALVLGLLLTLVGFPSSGAAASGCSGAIDGSAGQGFVAVSGRGHCGPIHEPTAPGQGEPIEWIDCGRHVSVEAVHGGADAACFQVAVGCEGAGVPQTNPPTTNLGEFRTNPDGSRTFVTASCNAPLGPAPAGVSGAAVWQEIMRRVPHPAVRVAPASGRSLVNIQTLLWADTPTQVDLGTVRLAGQLVRLRVTLRRVAWDFGDGHTDTTTDPGKAYNNDADPCDTKMCPDYYGHVYDTHGLYTVTAQTSWTGQYQLAAGPWRQIPNPVTGPPQTTTVHIYQAHGELVPDPTDSLHPAH